MDENLPTLTVPPTRKPSFVNIRAAIGFAIGWLTPVPFAPVIGLAIGSWLGKRKMQYEEINGKQVGPPSNWNIGTFLGGIGGLNMGFLAAGLTALAVSTGGIGLVGWLGISGAATACTAVGGWIGAKVGKHFQKREYAAAEQYVMQNGEFTGPKQELAKQPSQGMGQKLQPQQQIQPVHQQGQGASISQAHQQINPGQLARLQAFAAEGQRMAPPQPESMTDKVGHSRQAGPQER